MKQKSTSRALRIGMTGGIACGKTTIANLFAKHGTPIIDTDVIARELVLPGQAALDEIVTEFGTKILNTNGELDRQALRDIVFSSASSREQLEKILHPKIRDETWRQASLHTTGYILIVVPLLFESPMKAEMDRILLIDCSEQTQIQRLMARDNCSEEDAQAILDAQSSRAQRLSIANDLIVNERSLESAEQQVSILHARYQQLAETH